MIKMPYVYYFYIYLQYQNKMAAISCIYKHEALNSIRKY